MAINNLQTGEQQLLYAEATDDYLQGLPLVDTHNFAADYAKRPVEGLLQALDQASDAVRRVECGRRLLAGTASWLTELVELDAAVLAELPAERLAQVHELAGRVVK